MTIAKRKKGVPFKKRELKKSNSIKKSMIDNSKRNKNIENSLEIILPELEDQFINTTSMLNNILE
jgi:hypothetical protein